MKVTNDEVIRNGEQELIDSINGELDWEAMEEIFRKEHKLEIGDDIEYKRGDIVVYEDQIAYRLEFEVKVTLSLMLDRAGNYIPCETDGETVEPQDIPQDATADQEGEAEPTPTERADRNDLSDVLDEIDLAGDDGSTDDMTDAILDENSQDRISQAAALAGSAMEELEQKIN